jgi:hypothetical protein
MAGSRFVSPEIDGWVAVFDELCDWANEDEILVVGRAVCSRCRCPAVALAVTKSYRLSYWLFRESGELEDKSVREFVDPDDDEIKFDANGDPILPLDENGCWIVADVPETPEHYRQIHGLLGEPERLARIARDGVTVADIRSALEADHLFREDNLDELANLLGIKHYHLRYSDLGEVWDDSRGSIDWSEEGGSHLPQEENDCWRRYVCIDKFSLFRRRP